MDIKINRAGNFVYKLYNFIKQRLRRTVLFYLFIDTNVSVLLYK